MILNLIIGESTMYKFERCENLILEPGTCRLCRWDIIDNLLKKKGGEKVYSVINGALLVYLLVSVLLNIWLVYVLFKRGIM